MLALKPLSVLEIRTLETNAKNLGFSERILIENASSNLCVSVDALGLGKKVLVVAGRGNNGADVLACARKLISRNYEVAVAILSEKPLGKEAKWQKDILKKIKCTVIPLNNDNMIELKAAAGDADFIVDGILGIGVRGEVDVFIKTVIAILNESRKTIVSCDIPSGLSPDEGAILGAAICADYTITFIAPKKGFLINKGPDLCGEVFVVDVGIAKEALEKIK